MKRWLLVMLAGCVCLLAGCATHPSVATPNQPHGIVTTTAGVTANSIYPVGFYRIGDRKIAGNSQTYWLKPGTYTVTVYVNLSQIAANEPVRLPNTRFPTRDVVLHSLRLTVREGWRYVIGGKWEGPQVTDWTPIVVRAEPGA